MSAGVPGLVDEGHQPPARKGVIRKVCIWGGRGRRVLEAYRSWRDVMEEVRMDSMMAV